MKKGAIFLVLISLSFGVVGQLFPSKKKTKQKPLDVTELNENDVWNVEKIIIEAERELILGNEYKALELYKSAMKVDPNIAVVNFKIAEILLKNGETRGALPYAQNAAQASPSNKFYLLLAAEIYKALSDYQEAARLYEQMINNIKGTSEYLYDLAIIYQYLGEYEKALQTYEKAEAIYGMNEMVLREKQKIYLKEKRYDELIVDWEKLIAENPEETIYRIELCEFLISQNLKSLAKSRLLNLENDPKAAQLLMALYQSEGKMDSAAIYMKQIMADVEADYKIKLQVIDGQKRYAKTQEEIEDLLKVSTKLANDYPAEYEVQAYTGDLMYHFQQPTKARDYYMKAVNLDPSHFGVWQNILNIEAGLAQYDSVIVHAEKALEYFPNQALLYYFGGSGYHFTKEYKKSVQLLETGKKYVTDPKLLSVFYGQMGDAYHSLEDLEKSYSAYENALISNPSNDHVLNNYSYYLSLEKTNLDKAMEMSARLVKMYPDNPTYLDTHGWVLYVKGQYNEALIMLEKAAELLQDGTIIEHYGDVLYQLGDVNKAVEQWERARELGDVSENIEKKIADRKLYE